MSYSIIFLYFKAGLQQINQNINTLYTIITKQNYFKCVLNKFNIDNKNSFLYKLLIFFIKNRSKR
jgi:hypothetical protein